MADEQQNLWSRMLSDPYLLQVPSQRPSLLPTPGVTPGRPTPALPLKAAIVGKLRAKYPDLSDLDDDELLTGVHKIGIEDKQLPLGSTVDDMLKYYQTHGIVIKTGQMGRTGPLVSAEQMNVPVIGGRDRQGNLIPPSENVYPDLVKMHWPELADLDPKTVLQGVFREQRKSGKLTKETTFDQFLISLRGTGEATAIGRPGKTAVQLATGLIEPFLAPAEAAIGALAAGAEETPEAQAARTNAASALGRGAGAFVTLPIFAAEAAGLPSLKYLPKAAISAKELIVKQIVTNARAMGIYNALTTAGDVAPEVASGDETVTRALTRIGISTAIGAGLGAILGPTLGAGTHVERIAVNKAVTANLAKLEMQQLQQKAVQTFITDFKPEWIGTRFNDVFDPALPDGEIAQKIVSQLGPVADPAMPHYQTVVDAVTQKVGEYRALQEKSAAGLDAKVYPELPAIAGPEEVPVIAQPVGAPLATEGGIAPEPNVLPGPLGEQTPPFVPPTKVPAVPGLEGAPSPAAAPPEPITPEATPVTPGPVEPAPGLVGPGEGVPVTEPHAPEAVQGPVGTPAAEFTPPGKVRRLSSLQGPAAAIGREVQPEIVVPAEVAAQKIRGLGVAPFPGSPIRRIGNVEVQISTNPASKGVILDNIMSLNPGKGEATQVLKQIIAVADEHGVPVELQAFPYERPEGGRIPLVKLVDWYKKHGFESVDEGNGWASMRRVPTAKDPVKPELELHLGEEGPAVAARVKGVESANAVKAAGDVLPGKRIVPGSLGERIEKQLDLFAKTANERLTKKLGRLSVGFDPSNITDMAIIGAAQMFKLGMRSKKLFTEAMSKLYGKVIEPYINEIYDTSLKILKRSVSGGPTSKQLTHLLGLAESGKHGMNWYEGTTTWVTRTFGEDSDMFLRFLAATSADSQNEAGASMALKAYHQWKMGMPFDGMRSKSMVTNLERAARSEQFGGDKIDSYYRALRGDKDAVVLDRWMMRALGFKHAGTAGASHNAFGDIQYRMFSEVVRDLSNQEGMTPRQFQAAVWEGTRVAALHGRFAKGGALAASRVGSARPLETLVESRLGGMTPLQWIERNSLRFKTLQSISQGLKVAREQGGYTYDPFTYEADKTPGYVVTLASENIPKNLFYSNAIVDFRKQFATQIGMSAFGDMYRGGQHLNIGTWNMGEAKPDHFSVDLNIVLPENMREQAMALGLANKQFEVGHIDPAGNYTGFKTGYDPKIHGPQDVPPPATRNAAGVMGHSKERAAWFDRANIRVGQLLDQLGSPEQSPATLPTGALNYMVEHPAEAISHASQVLGVAPEEIKKLIDTGQFKPMTDAGVAGAVFVTKDGTIWQYVDPVKPSYNTTKLVGSLKIPAKRVALLDQLRGMEVLRGHEVIDQFRGEVGQVRLAMPEPIAGEKIAQLTTAMTKSGGTIVSPAALNEGSSGIRPNSFWMLPNGRIVSTHFMHMHHADRIAQEIPLPKVKGYTSMNGAGPRVQSLLNQGVIRIQASGSSIGIDVSAKITPTQRSLLQSAIKSHPDWSAQISDAKGDVVSIFRAYDNDQPHHFLAQATGEGK